MTTGHVANDVAGVGATRRSGSETVGGTHHGQRCVPPGSRGPQGQRAAPGGHRPGVTTSYRVRRRFSVAGTGVTVSVTAITAASPRRMSARPEPGPPVVDGVPIASVAGRVSRGVAVAAAGSAGT